MRCAWRGISSSRPGVFQRCQTSNWIPTASLPTSSRNSAASPSVFRIDQLSIPSSWNGSTARRRPSRSASRATSRTPRTAVSRSPGPVKQRIAAGAYAARTSSERSIASTRSRTVSGPGSSGSGCTDGTAGTAVAEPRPLSRNSSSEPLSSLISQTPIPSTPASVYARTPSAKLADSVLTCEIENRGTLDTCVRMVSFGGFRSKELRPMAGERASARNGPLRERRLEQLPCDDRPRAGAETRARPGARPDLPQPLDRRRVAGTAPERPPEKVLVECERAAVGVAVPEIDVGPLQVVRAERDPLQDRRLEVGDVSRQARL